MEEKRSLIAFKSYEATREKFDYFILGIIGALSAYMSQNIEPTKLGINPGSLEIVSFLIVILSGIYGYLRIDISVEMKALNALKLHYGEEKGEIMGSYKILKAGNIPYNKNTGHIQSPEYIQERIKFINNAVPKYIKKYDRLNNKVACYYKLRNRCLLLSFLLIIVAKVWSAY